MSIRMSLDPTNPGQFFACCGMLELADRLWRGAEGWFEGGKFHIDCAGTLDGLMGALANSHIDSSLTDGELQRLGTLLSAKKSTLTSAEAEEKQSLSEAWKRERLTLTKPFDLTIDWWWDQETGAKGMKTWAAKQLVIEIARPLLRSLSNIHWTQCSHDDALMRKADVDGLPFYFDAANNSQNTPRDTGFGLYALKDIITKQATTRPLVELGAFIGIQRFRPAPTANSGMFRFSLWSVPLPVSVAAVAAAGFLGFSGEHKYEFRMLYRSEYMKAFLPGPACTLRRPGNLG
jgi:CRISPR-associated protein Csb3